MTEVLPAAREAYRNREWVLARNLFDRARLQSELAADDLNALADATWWLGEIDESLRTSEHAYRRYLDDDLPRAAAMVALNIATFLVLRGEEAAGSGWLSRAVRLLQDERDCPEQAYLTYAAQVEGGLDGDDLDAVLDAAREVHDAGRRHEDPTLVALGLTGQGRALIRQGRVSEGMAALDDAMTTSMRDGLSPDWVGNIYCHLMSACHEIADIRRARQWTDATTRWLDSFPAAVVFAGICRVHRSQVLQTTGAWHEAEQEASRVCVELANIATSTAAEAHYQVGELRRLRGDFDGARAAYLDAHELGRDPQPGFALLRLAEGHTEAAASSVRAALIAETRDRLVRARLCAAQVEIALAATDIETARKAASELAEIAGVYGSAGLRVMARHAHGLLMMAEGGPEEALPVLRDACREWRALDAPYECARVRVVLAEVYDALGDADTAAAERRLATDTFARLGAAVDARILAERSGGPQLPDRLTAREAEVLALVADGMTNRQIAQALVLSDKTVARHLSNIFGKIGVSSRTEAAAYAFQHHLSH